MHIKQSLFLNEMAFFTITSVLSESLKRHILLIDVANEYEKSFIGKLAQIITCSGTKSMLGIKVDIKLQVPPFMVIAPLNGRYEVAVV